ncbi:MULTISPECIES: hypothetical protein [Sphingobacterium]|uniref:Uncharacterized protein n=3 Tax=Sphingobacterium TaxID=28453 RepID=A0A2X2IUG2_SPHMU|nr:MULTISPECIES: hypothetical protein [Sphingobacterium]HAE69347.1 hypothetical protein [Sphingobacterium sp.]OFV15969.1 hypothetical protein HMPREF3127_11405 [Sphingobacterium sp. HMSC13C05]QQT44463.1 hypothetical protein I6J00_22540 [Sphingobacterium multivorum]QRQ62036.1 hypothetical protein I6J33_03325 [Sphingobacterium multivorum]SPZ83791.1 Uncharacterised protein [Sphingobacterium multivorum]
MNRILALQFAFDRMIYDVHSVDYDPIKEIETFWNHYSLETVSANTSELLIAYVDGDVKKNRLLKDEEIQEFATALYRVLIAYCIANHRHIELSTVQLSAEAKERIGKELELSRKLAEFFGRLSG